MNRNQRRKVFSRRGQSVIEYIVLMGVVIAFLIIFMGPGGHFQDVFEKTIQQQGSDMLNVAVSIFN